MEHRPPHDGSELARSGESAPADTDLPGADLPGRTDLPGPDLPGPDLLGMDLEDLRTVDHPVLAALVDDLRRRVAAPGSEAMWGFDNDSDDSGPGS